MMLSINKNRAIALNFFSIVIVIFTLLFIPPTVEAIPRVSRSGCTINVAVCIDIYGPLATSELAQKWEEGISWAWNGAPKAYCTGTKMPGCKVVFDVTVTAFPGTNYGDRGRTGDKFCTKVKVVKGPYRSRVYQFSDRGTWADTTEPTDVAHEAGHILGLGEDYHDVKMPNGETKSVTNEGHEGHLMGDRNSAAAQHEIDDVLKKLKSECPVDPCCIKRTNTTPTVYCSDSNKIPGWEVCDDDCDPEKGEVCNLKSCVCELSFKEDPELKFKCSDKGTVTSGYSTDKSKYVKGTNTCEDNCDKETEECNTNTCVCETSAYDKKFKCSDKGTVRGRYYSTDKTEYDSFGDLCVDNCDPNEDEKCNLETCECEESSEPKKFKCSDKGTVTSGYATDKSKFVGGTDTCEDNCDSSAGEECNTDACVCEGPKKFKCSDKGTVTSGYATDKSKYDYKTDVCENNCNKETQECDVALCVCITPLPKRERKCSQPQSIVDEDGNVIPYNPVLDKCIDDCEPGQKCDINCVCQKSEPKKFKCSDKGTVTSGYATDKSKFVGGTDTCEDNCDSSAGEECNTDACVCEKPLKQFGCSGNTDDTKASGINNYPQSEPINPVCMDDCPTGWTCNEACLCEPEEIILANCADSTNPRNWNYCNDNCPYGVTCDLVDCVCEYDTTTTTTTLPGIAPSVAFCGDDTKVPGWSTCEDNCPQYTKCNTVACICEPDATQISCNDVCGQNGKVAYAAGEDNPSACSEKINADMQAGLDAIPEPSCFLTCKYGSTDSGYTTVRVDGTPVKGCCCIGETVTTSIEIACSDCPGQNPYCPPKSTCPANPL